jgi:hypothetical protein
VKKYHGHARGYLFLIFKEEVDDSKRRNQDGPGKQGGDGKLQIS